MPISRSADPAPRPAATTPILITMGEPGGVGPELAVRAFAALKGQAGSHPLRLVGDPAIFRACGAADEAAVIATRPAAKPRVAGRAEPENALAVTEAIETAVAMAMKGAAAAIVTAPIHKAAMRAGGFLLSRPHRIPPGTDRRRPRRDDARRAGPARGAAVDPCADLAGAGAGARSRDRRDRRDRARIAETRFWHRQAAAGCGGPQPACRRSRRDRPRGHRYRRPGRRSAEGRRPRRARPPARRHAVPRRSPRTTTTRRCACITTRR